LCGDPPSWEIDTWLMSCRVLGRKVEQAMLDKVAREAAVRGVRRLVGRYIPTAKNAIVAEHYGNLGFRRASAKDGGQTLWEMDVDTYSTPPLPMTSEDRFIQPASDNRSDLTTSDPGN
jgi:predicted enzyme involved in methoxymalonyl-ACP biosynthesis